MDSAFSICVRRAADMWKFSFPSSAAISELASCTSRNPICRRSRTALRYCPGVVSIWLNRFLYQFGIRHQGRDDSPGPEKKTHSGAVQSAEQLAGSLPRGRKSNNKKMFHSGTEAAQTVTLLLVRYFDSELYAPASAVENFRVQKRGARHRCISLVQSVGSGWKYAQISQREVTLIENIVRFHAKLQIESLAEL